MIRSIAAIPTLYAGIKFRSKLEAQWASHFDIIKMPWNYEPFEIGGRLPDFIINYHGQDLVFEVKPQVFIDDEFISNLCFAYCDKLYDFLMPVLIGNDMGVIAMYIADPDSGMGFKEYQKPIDCNKNGNFNESKNRVQFQSYDRRF